MKNNCFLFVLLLQEGFIKIDVKGKEFDWSYVDYGWETGISSP